MMDTAFARKISKGRHVKSVLEDFMIFLIVTVSETNGNTLSILNNNCKYFL